MKKLYLMLLTMLFCVVSVYSQRFEANGISYNVTKQPTNESPGEVEVTGGQIKEVIEFPETITYNDVTYMVTSIGNDAFSGRRNYGNYTKKYIIPGTVRTIGNSAFYDNYYLEEVEFNEGLLSIGSAAFEYNFVLKEICIPSTVTTIAKNAFHTNQQNLATISCRAATPPSIQSSTFGGRTDATLHVVATDVDVYRDAENWKSFSNITGDIIYGDRCYAPQFSFDNFLLTISCLTEGAAIYYTTDGSTPDENAIRYNSPIPYTTNQIIRAIAIAEGMENSAVRNFKISQVYPDYYTEAPTISWNGEEKTVSITHDDPDVDIYYTLDRTDPDWGSTLYTQPIPITKNTEIRAFAVKNGKVGSDVVVYKVSDIITRFYQNGIYYQLAGNMIDEVQVDDARNASGDVIISNTVTHSGQSFTVIGVNEQAFLDNGKITSIVLPTTIESIGQSAFYNCYALTDLVIPNSVKTIESNTFSNCRQLAQIEIPSSVKHIQDGAFSDCSALKNVIFHEGLQSIGNKVFRSCSSIQSLQLPESLTDIGTEAFKNCSSLASITLPSTLSYIPAYFLCETGLVSIEIPSSVKTIGNWAFSYCSQLTSVKIPEGIEKIENYAFFCCNALTSVVLPSTLTTVENAAFYGTSLSTVTLPENLSTLGSGVFENCASLTSVYSLAATPPAMPDGNAFNGVFSQTTLFVKADVVDTYKNANYWAEFSDISSFDQMPCAQPTFVFSNYELSISSLTQDATIYYTTDGSDPTTSSTIYSAPIPFVKNGTIRAIAVCDGYYNSVISVFDKNDFKVSAPEATISENYVVTLTCPDVRNDIEGFPQTQLYYTVNRSSWQWNYNNSGWQLYEGPIQLTGANWVHVIAKRDGWGDSDQKDFDYWSNYVKDDVTFTIDNIKYTHDGKSFINGEVCVSGHSFEGENGTIDIIIPERVTNEGINYIVTSIDNNAFSGLYATRSVRLPLSIKSIGDRAFYDNYYLEEIEFNDGLQTIGYDAFGFNFLLKEIRIPCTVTSIEDRAFRTNRQNLATISCMAAIPPTNLGSEIFQGRMDATLHVVAADIDAYRDAENWKDFSEISGDITYRVKCYSPVITYANDLLTMSCNTEGANIYYTTDGSNPDENAIRYTSPIPYTTNQIIRAIAIADGMENSAVRNFYDKEQIESVIDDQGVQYTLKVADNSSFYYAVTGHSDEMDMEIVIPADLNGCPVKSIENAFNGCTDLLSIIIPKSVTTIGNNAFNGCTAITSITIPNSVTSIGNMAFSNCENLTSVKIGNNVRSIGDNSFRDCSGLTSIIIPNSVTSIGECAFENCSGLTSVTIGNGVTVLKRGTFSGCSSLTAITIPDNVIRIEDASSWGVYGSNGVFSHCRSLTSVTISNNVTHIGNAAFYECNLTSVTIPGSIETMGSSVFSNNRNLTTAILKDGISEIASYMFAGCSALTSVIIPDGVTSIGGGAFSGCNALTSIKLPESLTSIGEGALPGSLKSIELPNSFTTIPDNLFSDNDFQYIKLGNNVKSIGKNAFGSHELLLDIGTSTPPTIASDALPNMEYLSDINVIVPDTKAETAYRKAAVWQEMTFSNQTNVSEVTVETPGDLSFELITQCNIMPAKVVGMKVNGTINADDFTQMLVNMKSLLRLDLSDCNITAVPDDALNGKTQLQELTLPTGLQTIGNNAFQGCPYLRGELNLPPNLTSVGESAFVGTNYTSVKLPSTLKTIGNYAFNNVPIKQKLSLPNRVTSVGAHAFEGTKITELVIYDGMKSIGDYAFAGTPIQGHVTIPDGVTDLGRGAFSNTQISTVFLPNSITTLSHGLFQGCPNLNTVYVPDNYTTLSSSVFDGCGALTILRLSANLTSMEEYSLQNIPLEYIKVPSQVEVLSRGVLKNCKNLTSLSLPTNLKSVENEALYGCTALRNLSVEAIDPPTIKDRSAIRGINTDLCLISIPTESYRKYVLAEYWGQFVQMRNDIAVETSGNGEIAFEGVDEEGTDDEEEVQPDGTDVAENEFEEDSKTHVSSGSSIYVPQEGKVRFYIMPAEGEKLVSATLDGEDITPYIEENVYVATADKKNAKLVVNFSDAGQGGTILPGDVNDDGEVSVTDVGCVINYILEQIPEPFIYAAADMNGDDEISVTDVGYIINYILNDGASYSRAIRRATYSYGAPTLTADNNGYVLAMDGADAFIGFQMDVIVPGDAKGCNVQLKKTETGHRLACRRLSNGHYRMVCYSPVNETFSEGITDLLTIASEGDMAVRNIRFTTESLDEVRFADISATPTGIVNVVTDQKATDVEVYTLDGQLYRVVHARPGESPLKDLEPGIYLINKRKFIVR